MFKHRELVKILEKNGFFLARSNKHNIFKNANGVTIAVPNHKVHSIGLCRRILQQANLKHEINF